jgi:hypothetical protein
MVAMLALDSTSGVVEYLKPEVFPRPAIYSRAPDWVSQGSQANVVILPVYTFITLQQSRYLTSEEQQVFNMALRRSVKVVHSGASRT